jgi:hypothetical protein
MFISLAMAEMTTLVAAVYRMYSTSLVEGFENVAPGVTSRFEVFHDDTFEDVEVSSPSCMVFLTALTVVEEHKCPIKFTRMR